MSVVARRLVSKKKKRFQENGYDLDLSYVTDRIIAMGFPSIQLEGLYRNNMADVIRFLEERHKDHYKVYNLCSERAYEHTHFKGRVERFPFDDHNAPPFEIMICFCRSADEWLKKHPENVIIIHCKAGKGRTGVMICAYLIYSGLYPESQDALKFYAQMRTMDDKGVTIPSQIRYVHYFGISMKHAGKPPLLGVPFQLKTMRLVPPPKGVSSIIFVVRDRYGNDVYEHKSSSKTDSVTSRAIEMNCPSVTLKGDYKIIVREKTVLKSSKELLHFWFNTGFITENNRLSYTKWELDGPHKDKKHSKFDKDFRVELEFVQLSKPGSSTSIAAASTSASAASSSTLSPLTTPLPPSISPNNSAASTPVSPLGGTPYSKPESPLASRDSDEYSEPLNGEEPRHVLSEEEDEMMDGNM